MEKLRWIKSFEIGHASIDSQHRDLMECLNSVINHADEGQGEDAFTACLTMQSTLRDHLQAEEEILRAARFERLNRHKESHRHNMRRFSEIVTSCRGACKTSDSKGCLEELARLLIDDFITGDMDFKSDLKEKGVSRNDP